MTHSKELWFDSKNVSENDIISAQGNKNDKHPGKTGNMPVSSLLQHRSMKLKEIESEEVKKHTHEIDKSLNNINNKEEKKKKQLLKSALMQQNTPKNYHDMHLDCLPRLPKKNQASTPDLFRRRENSWKRKLKSSYLLIIN